MTFFDQYGRGYQSKAGPPQGPGSERLMVWQPMGSLTIRQADPRFSHRVTMAVDILSSASADALDAVSSASRWNESLTLDATSTYQPDEGALSIRYGIHLEEPWRSGFGGLGYSRSFNDDNTTMSASVIVVGDRFDELHPRGWNTRQATRLTVSDNLTLTQVLSPTTLLAASYGLTFQQGTLEQTWNSVYIAGYDTYGCYDDPSQVQQYDCTNRRRERFPSTRTRHAVAGMLAQHIPLTRSTLKLHYRYYRDDVGLSAHTGMVSAYQWFGRRFYLRLRYRLHHQTGVDFYTRSISFDAPENLPATADSDLAPFFAHQGGVKAVVYITPPASPRGPQSLDVGYARYQRTNNLHMNVFSVGWAKEF
jgi:hypothetical protein